MRSSIILVLLALASDARSMGEADRVDVALLAVGTQPGADETSAVERLGWELEKRTSIAVASHATILVPGDAQLRRHPLLAIHGAGSMPPLDERALDGLRAHLEAGGMLFIDSAETAPVGGDDPFDRDTRALVRRLFPRKELGKLPADHVLYRTFYLLDEPVGRRTRAPYLEAVILDGRIAILYSRNDVLGALARDRLGAFAHPVEPGGEPQREHALRLGINIVEYALCLDYKSDQVHVPFLLKRGHGVSP